MCHSELQNTEEGYLLQTDLGMAVARKCFRSLKKIVAGGQIRSVKRGKVSRGRDDAIKEQGNSRVGAGAAGVLGSGKKQQALTLEAQMGQV